MGEKLAVGKESVKEAKSRERGVYAASASLAVGGQIFQPESAFVRSRLKAALLPSFHSLDFATWVLHSQFRPA